MIRPSRLGCKILLLLSIWSACIAFTQVVRAQGVDVANRPVVDVRIEGLKQVSQKLVTNQIRVAKGQAYDAKTVQEDIVRITYLGRFNSVQARVDPQPDGSVVLTYVVQEQMLLSDVQCVGNKELTDQELLKKALLKAGDPADPFLIERGIQEIKRAYEKEGYFVTDVAVDQELLSESGILLYKIREGPRPKIRDIRFEGNKTFTGDELTSKIKSETALWPFWKGQLNKEILDSDIDKLRTFYRDRGYLDANVGRRIDISADQQNAIIVFLVTEGQKYTVDKISVTGNVLIPEEQLLESMELKVGDIFSQDRLRHSQQAMINMYGKIGYISAERGGKTKIEIERLFHDDAPMVDVHVKVTEGKRYTVGKTMVKGNDLTLDKVVVRQLRGVRPGRAYDATGIDVSERRLKESSLFSEATMSILGEPDDDSRDSITQVKEANTGSISFGAGISSDAGVIGSIEMTQKNFDITDYPESAGKLFTGRAFRGAGQYFSLNLSPGTQTQNYSVTFRDPYFLDTDYFLDTSLYYFQRDREEWSEERIGTNIGIGQRFGDVWSAAIRGRAEEVVISNIAGSAPTVVWDVQGGSVITTLGPVLTRDTTDSHLFPTHGNVLTLGISRAGALGGDYDFTSASVDFRQYWTVDEDFFGRRTVLSLRVQSAYIFDGNAPTFEKYYAGGQRSFRGFGFRGVSPRGIADDSLLPSPDPVGGNFSFLAGMEYNFPVYQDILRFVIFSDTGTVQDNVGFDQYRVTVGAGLRLKIPFLGQAPFALDFASPLIKRDGDVYRMVSFDLAVPF